MTPTTRFLSAFVALSLIVSLAPVVAETIKLDEVGVVLIDELDLPVREAGVVAEIVVKEGDLVEQDQLLLKMDNEVLEIQREAAIVEARIAELESQNDVDLRFANKSRAVSEAEFARSEQALKAYPKSVSRSELDQTKLVSERAELAAEQAQRDLDVKRLTLQRRCKDVELLTKRLELATVRAPLSGMVTVLHKQVGEWANTGENVTSLVRLDKLRVLGFVDGTRYDQSLKGAPVKLTVKLPPGDRVATFAGRVSFVQPEITVSGQLRIQVDIDNPDLTLRPGMNGTLEIDADGDRHGTSIPKPVYESFNPSSEQHPQLR